MPAAMTPIPKGFVRSMDEFHNYPLNLVERNRWGDHFLRSSCERLEDREKSLKLFVDEAKLQVPILEVNHQGFVSHRNLRSDAEVEEFFQADHGLDESGCTSPTGECREDPAYRAV